VSLFGITGVSLGKRNVKDPKLDQADELVEADKKVYVQVDLVDDKEAVNSDAILAAPEARPDLILKDWEFVETRLGRDPSEDERALLNKLKAALEREEFVTASGLSPEELKIAAVYNLLTSRPVIVAEKAAPDNLDELLLRVLRESGYISFLTVGGKENRAWLIRKGTTAWEAAGSIHSDLQKGFIRAEIISFDDFVKAGGETQAKRAGCMRLEQKEYVVQDGDITNFRFAK
jgi:ribosome-binding ATPase YchF (GTP1/OBG family)